MWTNLQHLHFSAVFKKELEKDVAGDTSGNFAKLLLALLQVQSLLITTFSSSSSRCCFDLTIHQFKFKV